MLKNNCVPARATGGTHWLEYLPGFMYCFVPSFDSHKGVVQVYDHIPEVIKDFIFSMEIEKVMCRIITA